MIAAGGFRVGRKTVAPEVLGAINAALSAA